MNRFFRFSGRVSIAALVLSSGLASIDQVWAVSQIPVPHRAVYKIGLSDSRESSNVVSAEGRMVFEIAGNACEGYTMNQRLVVWMGHNDSSDQLLDFRVSTFESGDGELYRFASRTYLDDKIVEEANGTAERKLDTVEVALDQPGKKSLVLNQTVMFPSQHLIALLAAAKAEQRFFSTGIYEGAGKGERADTVTAVIGAAGQIDGQDSLTSGKKGWPVSIAYFSEGNDEENKTGEELPDYQMSFTLFENGIARDLRMNYGDYVLSGDLEKLDALDTSECEIN